jgi:hypothetical protein
VDPVCLTLSPEETFSPTAAATDCFRRTGIFPIMHVVGVRKELAAEHPWLPGAVCKAFGEAKALALLQLADTSATKVTLPFVEEQLKAERETLGAALAQCLGAARVVLMRGHGCTVVAASLRVAVYTRRVHRTQCAAAVAGRDAGRSAGPDARRGRRHAGQQRRPGRTAVEPVARARPRHGLTPHVAAA